MSRVEDNEKMINNAITSLSTVGENGMAALTITQPKIANAIMNHVKTDILTDISKSLAVIADNMSYIVEDDKRRKEEQKKRTIPDYHNKNGTAKICGFCNYSDFTCKTLDTAVCHCALHNLDVAFTCSACDSFNDVRSDMTFEEFTKKWEPYFDEDELGELKKSWIKGLWNGEPMTLHEKYGDIIEE